MDDLGPFSLSIKQCVEPPKQQQQQQLFCDERKNKTSTEYYSEVKEKQESKEKRWLSNGKLKKTL
jgi:hypothetical protein